MNASQKHPKTDYGQTYPVKPSAWALELLRYLIDNHPNLIITEGREAVSLLCEERESQALEIMSRELSNDVHVDVALDRAKQSLYTNYLFSRFNVTKEAAYGLISSFSKLYPTKEIHDAEITKLISLCSDIFSLYQVNDLTPYSSDLISALTDRIKQYYSHK